MAIDQIQEAGVWPVNSNGEILLQSGTGTTNVVGYINSSQVPTDIITNKMVVKLPPEVMYAGIGNVSGGGGYLSQFVTGNGAGANLTRAVAINAWGDYNAVQLVFLNKSASACTVDNFSVAAGSTIYPSGTNNLALPSGGWGAAQGSVTVPAGSTYKPGMFITPKIPLRSISRAAGELDNGKYPLLFYRGFIATGNTTESYVQLVSGFPTKWAAVNEGFSLQTAVAYGGDYVASPNGWNNAPNLDLPALGLFGAIFTYDRKYTTVCSVGDSIWAGNNDGVTNICPFGFKATARIRAKGKYCSWQAGGISGSPMTQINLHGKDIISSIAPDILILPSYTINSPAGTQTDWDNQWYYVMDLVQTQLSLKKQVLLLTPLPNSSFNATQNGYRLKQRQRVIDSQLPYVDVESMCTSIGGWADATLTADGTHPLAAGHEVLAALVQPVLDTMIP